MPCFHCPGRNETHTRVRTTKYQVCNFGVSVHELNLLYLHLKLALYNIKRNAKIYANHFKVCFITLFLLRMTLNSNTNKKYYDRSRKRS